MIQGYHKQIARQHSRLTLYKVFFASILIPIQIWLLFLICVRARMGGSKNLGIIGPRPLHGGMADP